MFGKLRKKSSGRMPGGAMPGEAKALIRVIGAVSVSLPCDEIGGGVSRSRVWWAALLLVGSRID